MEVPLFSFLLVYGIGLFMFFVWAAFHLYHMVKFGMFDFTGKLNTFIFMSVSIIIFLLTALLLQGTLWREPVPLFNPKTLKQNIERFDRY